MWENGLTDSRFVLIREAFVDILVHQRRLADTAGQKSINSVSPSRRRIDAGREDNLWKWAGQHNKYGSTSTRTGTTASRPPTTASM